MSNAVISLKGVACTYDARTPIEKTVLSDVTLTIENGETIGLMGASGSGKTTLARVMTGLLPPTSGTLVTPGIGPGKAGLLFQFPEHQLFCDTVFEDITYTLREILNAPPEQIELKYREACAEVGLNADLVRRMKTEEMSSGEKRRVALAGLLSMNPEVLILDEPAAGLDQAGKLLIRKELAKLSRSGKTLIVISHDMEDMLADGIERIIYLEKGKIVEDGTIDTVLAKLAEEERTLPMLPFTTRLLVNLQKRGLNVRNDINNPDEAVKEIKKALSASEGRKK